MDGRDVSCPHPVAAVSTREPRVRSCRNVLGAHGVVDLPWAKILLGNLWDFIGTELGRGKGGE